MSASMEEFVAALKQAQAKNIGSPNAILDVVHEWKGMGENLLKSLVDCVSGIESRENNLSLLAESLEKRLRDLEEREREFELFQEGKKRELALKECGLGLVSEDSAEVALREEKLDEQLKLVHEHIESLEVAYSEVESLRLLECDKLKEIEERKREVDFLRGSLEKRLREVEEREKEFDLVQDGKLRELALQEELFSRKREQFVKEVKLTYEKFGEGQKKGCGLIKRLESALKLLESMKVTLDEKFKEIESRETVAHKSLTACLNEADLIRESLEKRFVEFEKMEKEFNSFPEDKMQKLEAEERQLNIMKKQLLEEVRSMDKKLTEQQKLGNQVLKSLQDEIAKKLKEIESQELTLHVARETLDARVKDADFKRESANMRLQELEKREEKFRLYQEKKMRELVLAEEKLRLIGKEFIQEVKLRKENFDKQEKSMHGLLERLEWALNNVKDMNSIVSERFKEVCVKEIEHNYIKNQVGRKTDELELKAKELRGQETGIKAKEHGVISKKSKIEGKEKERELKEGSFESWRKELECKEQHMEQLGCVDKNLDSVREHTKSCFEENIASNKLHQQERYLVENHAGCLAEKDQQSKRMLREVESNGQQIALHLKECESKHRALPDALDTHLKIEPDESVYLKQAMQMDGKTLEMFLNDTEKALELIGDEIFKVLLLSSDPAKLVLDAVEGIYRPHLGRGDLELRTRRLGILLLDQLTKMSPKIQPRVREAAIELASEWNSKLRTPAEDPLEVLGFLHLLAAFNLSSNFDKDELLSLVKTVAQHKQTPDLCRILGLTEKMPGFIQNLIKEKQYLLASTYIYECELQDMFPQAAVLDFYVKHSKMLGNAKCKREHNSSEAQDKAIVGEIADLRIAIEHILKHGLESEYSPDILTARIKQLERDRASLKNATSSSSADRKKQEKRKRSAQPPDANKREAQQKQHDGIKEASPAPEAQPSEQYSEAGSSSLFWKAQHQQSERNIDYATTPVSFHESWSQQEQATKYCQPTKLVDEVPMTHPGSARKRHRTDLTHNGTRHLRSPSENHRSRR